LEYFALSENKKSEMKVVVSPNDDKRKSMEVAASFIVPAIATITAIILIVAGGRLLKSAIGLSGGLLGAGAGLMVAPSLSVGISPFIIALVFGVIAAVVAIYIAKFAILFLLSVTFACALPVVTWHLAGLGNGAQTVEKIVEAASTPEPSHVENSALELSVLSATEDAMSAAFALLTRDATRALRSGFRRSVAAWKAVPIGPRFMLAGSAVAGLLLGLLVATFMPFLASSIVTSVGGSILLIEAIRNFVALIWSQQSMASISPTVLLFTCIGIALAGIGLQLTLAKRTQKSTLE